MPELPEVETIRRQLARVLPGKVFSGVEVRLAKQLKNIHAKEFKSQLVGAKVVGLDRRAKMLIVKIKKLKSGKAKEQFLVFHLKMSGQLVFRDKTGHLKGGGHPIKGALEKLPNKYSHVYFSFKDGSKLFFNDTRQFGWAALVDSYKEIESLSKSPLGPEPLARDFKLGAFISCLRARQNMKIYQAILDQKCVVGVGNIYVNEALFYSGIKPTRRIRNIKNQELELFYREIIEVLQKAVKQRGTTISFYMDAIGDIGNFNKFLKVYGKEGKSCQRGKCSGIVKRQKINGRSSFYCSLCQK